MYEVKRLSQRCFNDVHLEENEALNPEDAQFVEERNHLQYV